MTCLSPASTAKGSNCFQPEIAFGVAQPEGVFLQHSGDHNASLANYIKRREKIAMPCDAMPCSKFTALIICTHKVTQ
jgi:hypothetical protein